MAFNRAQPQNRAAPSREEAEGVAIRALGFLAADDARIARFAALSGLEAGNLRAAARLPGFLGGVLDHLLSDETLLLAFATEAGLDPALIAAARRRLGQ